MGFQFGAVLTFAVVAVLFALVALLTGAIIRPRFPNANKVSIYECGERPVGAAFLARSQARHRYQLATERNGAQRFPLLKSTSGLGRSAASSGRDLGTRWKVSAKPLRTP